MTTPNTWTRGRDGDWLVRGPPGQTGEVRVHRRDGTSSAVTLGHSIWTGDGVSLYTVRHTRPTRAANFVNRIKTGSRYECNTCGHDREMCQEIDCTCDECGGMMQ